MDIGGAQKLLYPIYTKTSIILLSRSETDINDTLLYIIYIMCVITWSCHVADGCDCISIVFPYFT